MRRSSRAAALRSSSRLSGKPAAEAYPTAEDVMDDTPLKRPKKRGAVGADEDEYDAPKAVTKKTKPSRRSSRGSQKKSDFFLDRLFTLPDSQPPSQWACTFPGRLHAPMYHRPLLLGSIEGRASLLEWFDGVSTSRAMPWRKAWIDPSLVPDPAELRLQLEKRAYQVWISEIMLQQVRLPTFVPTASEVS